MQTPGLAGIFVGPYDLSLALGLSADPEAKTAAMQETLIRIARSATAHRVTAGIHCSGPTMANAMTQLGYTFFTLATDMDHLRNSYRAMAAELVTAESGTQATKIAEPAAKGAEPAAKGAEPAATSAEPAAKGAAPAAKRTKPAAKGATPTAKRAAAPPTAANEADIRAHLKAWLDGVNEAESRFDAMQAAYEERTGPARKTP